MRAPETGDCDPVRCGDSDGGFRIRACYSAYCVRSRELRRMAADPYLALISRWAAARSWLTFQRWARRQERRA